MITFLILSIPYDFIDNVLIDVDIKIQSTVKQSQFFIDILMIIILQTFISIIEILNTKSIMISINFPKSFIYNFNEIFQILNSSSFSLFLLPHISCMYMYDRWKRYSENVK